MEDEMQKFQNAAYYNPENEIMNQELKKLLEDAVDKLPSKYKPVFIMREVEGLDGKETAQCLGLTEENIRIRLHRAKAMLKEELYKRVKERLKSSHLAPSIVIDLYYRLWPNLEALIRSQANI